MVISSKIVPPQIHVPMNTETCHGIGDTAETPPTIFCWNWNVLEHEPGKQQSTSMSKPSEAGQLFNPQPRPSWQSSWESQSPSFSEQVLQLQNPISPLLTVAQLTKERVIQLNFYI